MKNKNNIVKNLSKNYTKVPNETFKLNNASLSGFLAYLLSLPEDFNPSITHLTKKFKIGRATVKKWLTYLEKYNIIKKYDGGDFKTKRNAKYEFKPLKTWDI